MSEYESYEAQMEASTNAQKKFDDLMKQATPVLEKFKLLGAELAANFAPVLDVIGTMVQGLIDLFAGLNDESGGLLGTFVGGAAGIALFVSGLGGMIMALKTTIDLLILKPFHMIKDLFATKKSTQATIEETMADNANTASKEVNTATENLNTAAENANTGAKKAGNVVDQTSIANDQVEAGTKVTNTGLTNADTAAEGANTAASNLNNASQKTGIMFRLKSIAIKGIEIAKTAILTAGTYALNLAQGAATGIRALLAKVTTALGFSTSAAIGPTATLGATTKASSSSMGKAVPIMLALGAAIMMIGAGVYFAATGLGNLVAAFKGLTGGQLVAAGIALTLFGVGLLVLVGILVGLVAGPQAALVAGGVGVLLAIGGAIALIGLGVGLAAAGFSLMIGAIAIPSVEQYLAFGASMVLFGIGLYASAAAMAVFLPAFGAFMALLMGLAANPLVYVGITLLAAIAGSIFMIGLGAKLAMDSMANLISTIANSEGLGDIIGGLFGAVEDVGVSASVEKRVQIVRQLMGDVADADIKSELENLALITTGVSAGLMTENTVSNLAVISSLADTIQNIFNPDITIEMDSGAVEKLFREGVYKVSRST